MIRCEEEERAGTAQETATPFTLGYCMATKSNTSGEENETSSDSKIQRLFEAAGYQQADTGSILGMHLKTIAPDRNLNLQ